MQRFKRAATSVVGLSLLLSLASPAVAKRRRSAKPASDIPPATEVEIDTTTRAATMVVPAPVETPSDPPAEKRTPPAPAAVAADREVPRGPAPAAAAPPEAETSRASARAGGDLAANRVTAHVGVGSPLVTLRATRSTQHVGSVTEDFTLVAPIGFGLQLTDSWMFDFEFQVSTGVRPEGLTTAIVDPGVIYMGDRLGAGVRVGWQLNANQNVGLIPLARVAVLRSARANWFVEASLPSFVRNKQLTASASLQTGIGF